MSAIKQWIASEQRRLDAIDIRLEQMTVYGEVCDELLRHGTIDIESAALVVMDRLKSGGEIKAVVAGIVSTKPHLFHKGAIRD